MKLCLHCNTKLAIDPARSRKTVLIPGWCHTCLFWKEISDAIKNGSTAKKITQDRRVYHFKEFLPNPSPGQMLGFGGHFWRIVQEDKVLITNNLWLNGDIPDNFKDDIYLQPNCVIEQDVSIDEVEQVTGHYQCTRCYKFHPDGYECNYEQPVFKRTTRSLEELEGPDDDYPF